MTHTINHKIYFYTGFTGLLIVMLIVPAFAQKSQSLTEQAAPPAYSSYYPLENYIRANRYLPIIAIKTNLLYGIGTLTPNLAMELGMGARTSFELSGSYNPWKRTGTLENNDKLVHWIVRPEFRYWFCERFNRHFVGVNALYSQFNISGKNIPFADFKKDFRYEGHAAGTGLDYGYHWLLGGRWALEFSAGVGLTWAKYDTFECVLCSTLLEEKTKLWFGLTYLSVSLEFLIR